MSGSQATNAMTVGKDAIVFAAALSACGMNWLAYQATGSPFPYCQTKAAFGPLLANLFDGVRACMFVWVLWCLVTANLKGFLTPLGIMAFTLLTPGFVEILFGLGPCRPVMPVFAGWAESIWHGITAPFVWLGRILSAWTPW